MSTVGPGLWRGNRKRTWNMARKLTIEKRGNGENHIVGHEIWRETVKNLNWIVERKLKNVENKTQTLYDLESGEKK
uniref:Uncharacterized protein n=1 Tax=Trichinella nativa TaxID=6335 RepID=A0A0V1KJY3_9BILA